jgi:hypothetical protein
MLHRLVRRPSVLQFIYDNFLDKESDPLNKKADIADIAGLTRAAASPSRPGFLVERRSSRRRTFAKSITQLVLGIPAQKTRGRLYFVLQSFLLLARHLKSPFQLHGEREASP